MGRQHGLPTLYEYAGVFGGLDTDAIKERNKVDIVTGAAMRNKVYYDFMTLPGIRPRGVCYVKAPEYIQKGAGAAFTYGDKGSPEDDIPETHIEAYNSGKGTYTDADLKEIMDLIVANVPVSKPSV